MRMRRMTLTELSKEIHNSNKEKGFWDKVRNFGETLMLVVTELAECMEADRKGNYAGNKPGYEKYKLNADFDEGYFKLMIKDTVEDEVADGIIRLLDLSGAMNIDIDWHVKQKLLFNQTRPRMHGKKY